ncbi:TNF receptor-associated factor 4-like isoform X2 [Liolophura sinensis]|uniref:TNF receptor-associated factor 4-like isoform X2 n=1 Tax=Liolophura sinensis TaxID=3198878 RepID=UPI00315847B3
MTQVLPVWGERLALLSPWVLKSDGIFTCPEDQTPLDYAKIYPDPEVDEEIMTSIIRCTHYKEGCKWTDKAQNLQSHLDICRYDALSCPNKCNAKVSQMCLDDHLEFTCPRRRVKCEFCGNEFYGEVLEDTHAGNCSMEVVWCENKCGAKLQRKYLKNHMKHECHKRCVTCQYCQREFVEETLQTHQYQCPRYPVMCPNRCDPTKIPREEVDYHVQDVCPSATVSCKFKPAGCKYKGPRFGLHNHIEDNLATHLELAWSLVHKQALQIQQLTETVHTVNNVTNGVFIWKINDYKAKLMECMMRNNREKREIFSQPFYTSRHGYKMIMSAFLNGNGTGEGKFLSVYIKLLPGEYDNILDWPFTLPITITLFDQCSDPEKRINIKESFIPDPTWKHFQKPLKDIDSLGFGYPKFISLEALKLRSYIKDDSLMIKVAFDNGKFIIP